MKRVVTIVLPIAVVMLSGCAGVSGVVTAACGSRADLMVPDIRYVSAEGIPYSFNWGRQPLALVAFTSGAGLDSQLAGLSDEFAELPVTVAEISLSPEGAAERKSGMVYLRDPQHIAWEAFGRPAPGELLLIDENGRIIAKGTLADSHAVVAEARRLGEELRAQIRWYMLGGGGESS